MITNKSKKMAETANKISLADKKSQLVKGGVTGCYV
jgi:hypothetical protein